ncbi:hypothetical protein EWM64_g1643 [Hericium alpestre]|uniref:TAFII55 protein conserved region domain-containing protein n=1 Tax=Hericium alpestre TaxID=135208 RepID=A0A4Z0AA02_9AGAM|nr:hypothetical protein EWM64_g1643 [Hericium alpestre]
MEDDDLIVVDDVEPSTPYTQNGTPIPVASTSQLPGRPQRHSTRNRASVAYTEHLEQRTTRSSGKPKYPPRLKLKLGEKAAAQQPGMSFLGAYDRELDSDEEELAFEEQFILRMPPGEDCEKLRKIIAGRDIPPDVWFKFKDSRRAVFHIGNNFYSAKLVDLPCIIESQKTLDNKQMFKAADICQMLVVEERIPSEDVLSNQKSFNVDDFVWPHGLTPPLKHVRKRRFRKRVNKRTIESVEQEVERLLEQDAESTEMKYDVLDNVNPDLSDSEFIEREETLEAATPGGFASELGDALTRAEEMEAEGSEEEREAEGEIDEELAAELDLALGDEGEEGEEEEEEEEESEEEEEDEDEDEEMVQARQLLNEEINDLSAAVRKKEVEVASAGNPLIRKRFEDALKKLTADLEMKLAQRDEMKEMARRKKEGVIEDGEGAGEDKESEGDEEGDEDRDREGEDERDEVSALELEMQVQMQQMQMQQTLEAGGIPGGIPGGMPPGVLPGIPPGIPGPGPGPEGQQEIVEDGDLFGPEEEPMEMD